MFMIKSNDQYLFIALSHKKGFSLHTNARSTYFKNSSFFLFLQTNKFIKKRSLRGVQPINSNSKNKKEKPINLPKSCR